MARGLWIVGSGGGSGSGTITAIANEGAGTGLFDAIVGTTANFKTLVAGTNITITPAAQTVTIAASSSTIEVHGSAASPITITAAGGITPTSANDQVWWTQSAGGAVPITANPQIAAGSTIGQRLTLKGTSATNYIQLAAGSGVDQNGPVNLTNNQAIEYMWDGSSWSENTRRN